MMKIGFMSDLHLEFCGYPNKMNSEGGDVLILAGDITSASLFARRKDTDSGYRTDGDSVKARKNFEKLIREVGGNFSRIFMVMGNHDHYRGIYDNSAAIYREYFAEHLIPVEVLNRDAVEVDGVVIVGASLWTDFDRANAMTMYDAQAGMNDYRVIGRPLGTDTGKTSGDIHEPFSMYVTPKLTPEFILDEHRKDLSFIRKSLDSNLGKNVVVVTHHCPSAQSLNRKHSGNGLDGCYYTDLEDMIHSYPNIKAWIHGHTHMSVDYEIGYTRILANQCGYTHENMKFTGAKVIEL